MNTDKEQLIRYPLFSDIGAQEIAPLLNCIGAFEKKYTKGEYVIFDGDAVDCVALLLRGSVRMIKEDAWGEKSILAVMGEAQVFGESFVFGGVDSTVSFVAATDIAVLWLPFGPSMHLCAQACGYHQKLIDNMVGLIARKNIQLMEKLEITSKKSIRAKILTYLSQQSLKQQARLFVVPHGRGELADYLCVDRSALTRELSRMRDEGLLDYDRNTFRIG